MAARRATEAAPRWRAAATAAAMMMAQRRAAATEEDGEAAAAADAADEAANREALLAELDEEEAAAAEAEVTGWEGETVAAASATQTTPSAAANNFELTPERLAALDQQAGTGTGPGTEAGGGDGGECGSIMDGGSDVGLQLDAGAIGKGAVADLARLIPLGPLGLGLAKDAPAATQLASAFADSQWTPVIAVISAALRALFALVLQPTAAGRRLPRAVDHPEAWEAAVVADPRLSAVWSAAQEGSGVWHAVADPADVTTAGILRLQPHQLLLAPPEPALPRITAAAAAVSPPPLTHQNSAGVAVGAAVGAAAPSQESQLTQPPPVPAPQSPPQPDWGTIGVDTLLQVGPALWTRAGGVAQGTQLGNCPAGALRARLLLLLSDLLAPLLQGLHLGPFVTSRQPELLSDGALPLAGQLGVAVGPLEALAAPTGSDPLSLLKLPPLLLHDVLGLVDIMTTEACLLPPGGRRDAFGGVTILRLLGILQSDTLGANGVLMGAGCRAPLEVRRELAASLAPRGSPAVAAFSTRVDVAVAAAFQALPAQQPPHVGAVVGVLAALEAVLARPAHEDVPAASAALHDLLLHELPVDAAAALETARDSGQQRHVRAFPGLFGLVHWLMHTAPHVPQDAAVAQRPTGLAVAQLAAVAWATLSNTTTHAAAYWATLPHAWRAAPRRYAGVLGLWWVLGPHPPAVTTVLVDGATCLRELRAHLLERHTAAWRAATSAVASTTSHTSTDTGTGASLPALCLHSLHSSTPTSAPAPAQQKPAQKKPAQQKPAQQKPAPQKPAQKKPAQQKPTPSNATGTPRSLKRGRPAPQVSPTPLQRPKAKASQPTSSPARDTAAAAATPPPVQLSQVMDATHLRGAMRWLEAQPLLRQTLKAAGGVVEAKALFSKVWRSADAGLLTSMKAASAGLAEAQQRGGKRRREEMQREALLQEAQRTPRGSFTFDVQEFKRAALVLAHAFGRRTLELLDVVALRPVPTAALRHATPAQPKPVPKPTKVKVAKKKVEGTTGLSTKTLAAAAGAAAASHVATPMSQPVVPPTFTGSVSAETPTDTAALLRLHTQLADLL